MNTRLKWRVLPVKCFQYLALALALTPSARAADLPNRNLPKVDSPRTGLHFAATPSSAEIFQARVFEEPLVPVGGEPSAAENAGLAAALLDYSRRSSPDDFSSLTGFLEKHPQSPWRAALLTCLGLEYYNTAHYSLALEAWQKAWPLAKDATDAKGKAIADRAAGELAYMYARLGRMTELEALVKSVEGRAFIGSATEKITGAREGLWNMQTRPEISFRCGPMALQQIKLVLNPQGPGDMEIFNSASTTNGFSLAQVAELSKKIGLNYQMAFRSAPSPSPLGGERAGVRGDFIVPSVVHWKVGHYAALVRQEGDRYLLEDPTFGNTVWATRAALEAETSGYFLIPPGPLPAGWRAVESAEGKAIWGKGNIGDWELGGTCPPDLSSGGGTCTAMAVSGVHLMLVSLNLRDEPVGYSPPVGPAVRFTVRYNQRDAFQPANFSYSNFGPKWTCDWISYITDNPQSASADLKYYFMGGGTRTFTGFNAASQSFAYQQYDQTRLTRTGPGRYQMLARDGSKLIFGQSDGSAGTSRKIFLTQILDPFGNAVTLTYDANLRVVAITDAIGQVTTLSYELGGPEHMFLITRVTDPFGRFATFEYDVARRLKKITDVIGLTSQFAYVDIDLGNGITNHTDFITALITPYGTNTFLASSGPGTTRSLETVYPDGSRDRVEFNQSTTLIAMSNAPASIPQGMATLNHYLAYRNTYYWSRNACATGYGDYTKAKLYHWLHADGNTAAGILESTKEALEARVWYDYAGQPNSVVVGNNNLPTHVGRVLDNGTTQLSTYAYDGFGHVTNSIDPVGREMSYVYSTNGIDPLEVRQTRGANNELLSRTAYNAQHLPLTQVDAAGQTNTFTYNVRGQVLTATNPKNEITTFTYDANGYLINVDGPLPGASDVFTATYDAFGRTRTRTDESGYTLTFDYDTMDRLTRVTYPDSTFSQFTYDRLDLAAVRDSAGRQTLFEYDNMRQIKKRTDPLSRVTHFQWCSCGSLGSLTDPMGRTTEWHSDVQGRPVSKQYGDGSKVSYFYEQTTSRLRQVIDEKQQVGQYAYYRDDTLKTIAYANATIPTPGVSYTYDPNYLRVASMIDGTGTTIYSYNPITASPGLGAGNMASVDGPLANDTITYVYDELGRRVSTAINGVAALMTFDEAGRVIVETNALGVFNHGYEGTSSRLVSQSFPNGQTGDLAYGNNLQDRTLQRITHKVGATAVSEFLYGRNVPAGRITTWSQQAAALTPNLQTFAYDPGNQLLSVTITNGGTLVNNFAYGYDLAGNRLTEQVGLSNYTATYNALNQLSTSAAPGVSHTNEWDAWERLVAVNRGIQRTEFSYDGLSRLAGIRLLTNGVEASLRRFVWCGGSICEERDAAGLATKRFFDQGMKVESGPAAGNYFYTRDHLDSIREVTDAVGNVVVRYAYDPYGRRTRLTGNIEADFGFAGMFWSSEAGLSITHYRAYDPGLGRWLSRDPLASAELREGPNLYAYVANNPVNLIDPEGLITTMKTCLTPVNAAACTAAGLTAGRTVQTVAPSVAPTVNAVVCQANTVVGYALGPSTVPVLSQTVSSIAPSLPRLAPLAAEVQSKGMAAANWLIQTMGPQREYVLYLWRTNPEAARKFVDGLDAFSQMIFGH